jgi:phage gp29-like protein
MQTMTTATAAAAVGNNIQRNTMATILDQYGNPIQSEILHEPQTAKLAQLHREYANHPSRGLTPQRLSSILQQAEQGNLIAQAELFADMEEKDAHLYAEMDKRKRSILSIDWEVRPPRNASAQEKDQADYLTELLQDPPHWDALLLDALDAIGHGYSCIELEWHLQGKEWLVKQAHHRPPTWFQLSQYDQNELRLRDHSSNGAELTPFGWIIHKHRARSGSLARTGLHRVLAWPFLFKNYAIRDLAELLEIYGIPVKLGKYPPGTGDAEKATLLRAVTQLGHAAAGIIPESMAIEFEAAAAGNHAPFVAMIEWAEKSMSKAILGGTLTSQADGQSSTNALGNVHEEARREILMSDAKQLASTLTRDLLYPLLVLNGMQVTDPRRMPQIVFDVREEEDFKMLAESLPSLVNMDVPIPLAWVQRKLNIPARQGEEPILSNKVAAPAAPNEPVQNQTQKPVVKKPEFKKSNPQTGLNVFTALLTKQLGDPFPDQTAIDAAVDVMSPESLQAQADQMLGNVLTALGQASDDSEALGILAEAFPTMDVSALTEVLGNRLFIARLVGMFSAQQEIDP